MFSRATDGACGIETAKERDVIATGSSSCTARPGSKPWAILHQDTKWFLRASRLFMKVDSDSYDFRISRHFGPSCFFMFFGPILRARSHGAQIFCRLYGGDVLAIQIVINHCKLN